MRSRYTNIIVLLAAILSFLPVIGVDYVLDSYVRLRETQILQRSVGALANQIQANAYAGVGALRRILADSPSLCTTTFLANVQQQMQQNVAVKEVLVENADGVQYCDATGGQVTVSPLSAQLSMPGHTETVTLVRLGRLEMPVFKITQAFGATRQVSAFVPVLTTSMQSVVEAMRPHVAVRLVLTNGAQVLAGGDPQPRKGWAASDATIMATALAGDVPIRADVAVPFDVVRADYADLDVAFTIVAALISGAFLILMLQYVRRSGLPTFDLERAIKAGEIKPYYQPVIDLTTGRLAGCEVLVRWEKPNGETAQPGPFIDYAEMTGLAVPMTLSVMKQVKADLSELCSLMPDLKISINLFDGHFRDTGIVDDVQAIFGGSPIAYRQIVFEITERRPLPETPSATAVISGLHALGVRLALDDAGTGHSNLAFMQTLGVDVIKIDRIFLEMIRPGVAQVPVLDGLIGMARDLGADIVAEGIEREDQALYVRARGVRLAQGFLFAPALRTAAFVELAYALNGRPVPIDAQAMGSEAAVA